jgi:hypothetical protein
MNDNHFEQRFGAMEPEPRRLARTRITRPGGRTRGRPRPARTDNVSVAIAPPVPPRPGHLGRPHDVGRTA